MQVLLDCFSFVELIKSSLTKLLFADKYTETLLLKVWLEELKDYNSTV